VRRELRLSAPFESVASANSATRAGANGKFGMRSEPFPSVEWAQFVNGAGGSKSGQGSALRKKGTDSYLVLIRL